MRPLLLASLLLFAARTASAGNVNLRWNACWGDGGVMNKAFACDTNAGSNTLVGSFVLPQDGPPGVSGIEIAVDLATAGATLPAWWQFKNTGACRQTSLSVNFVISPLAVQCLDWANGQAFGSVVSYTTPYGPNSARILAASAVALPTFEGLFGSVEFFAFNLLFNNQKTVGTGSCSGCSLGACIDLKQIIITNQDSRNDVQLSPGGESPGAFDALATWQGGSGVISSNGGCPAATPTRNSTWGQVKALYR